MNNPATDLTLTLSGVNDLCRSFLQKDYGGDVLGPGIQFLAEATQSSRVSVVRVDDHTPDIGIVIASHDDPHLDDHVIRLEQYPELAECIYAQSRVVLDRVEDAPILEAVAPQVAHAGFVSLAIFPIVIGSPTCSTVVLRVAKSTPGFDAQTIELCELIASIIGLALERAAAEESVAAILSPSADAFLREDADAVMVRLSTEIARSERYGHALSIITLFVDSRVAQAAQVIGAIRSNFRPSDTLLEMDSGCYVIILPETPAEGAACKAEETHGLIANNFGLQADSPGGRVGFAVYGDDVPDTAVTMLTRGLAQLDQS